MSNQEFDLTLRLDEGYRFAVDFGNEARSRLILDEPAPLGDGDGPNAARVLGAAIGNCLGASLVFCLRKAQIRVEGLEVQVSGRITRNERGRLRIGGFQVHLEPSIPAGDRERIRRCLEIFEDFCMVTDSVRKGIDVSVSVEPAAVDQPEPAGLAG